MVDFKYLPEFERRAKDLAKKYKSFVKDYEEFLDTGRAGFQYLSSSENALGEYTMSDAPMSRRI